jgi:YesN/AraC family two-component response regulator
MSTTTTFYNLRILLVDDEPFVRRVIASMLKNAGIIEVFEANNGAEAIAFMGGQEIDLLISDIQMPEMNGLELIQKIRMGETRAARALRTIVVTSFSYTEVLSSCLLLDVNGFLVKPITPASAEEKIHLALNEKLHLRPAEAYLQVKTDLAVIQTTSKEEQRKPNAAIARSEPEVQEVSVGSSVPLKQLRPGMVLLDDLYATSGIKLLPQGQVLTEVMIHRIIDLDRVLPSGRIRVK